MATVMDRRKKNKLTELHCHILPGIDDGAKHLENAVELLVEEKNQGVENIVFTPHFNFDKITVEQFVERRDKSLEKLKNTPEFQEVNINFKLGSEVYYTVNIATQNLDKLCFEGTDYILVELPTQVRPHGMKRTFGSMISKGYCPIIAHVERYSYMIENPVELYEFVDMGCLAHVNAETVIEKNKMAKYFIKHGLVHFISSDCHAMSWRPPNLESGFETLRDFVGKDYDEILNENAKRIFKGKSVDTYDLKKPVNLMGIWI